jgi:membrane-bound lytic murein transglycosylase MltF
VVLPNAFGRDLDEIKKTGTLHLCYVPWFGDDTQAEYPSPDHEIALGFAKSLNLKVNARAIKWDQQFDKLPNQPAHRSTPDIKTFCDMFSTNMAHLDWRLEQLNITWNYSGRSVVFIKSKRLKEFTSPKDLEGKLTSVVPGTSYHNWLVDFNESRPEKKKIRIQSKPDGGNLSLLKSDRIDFVIMGSTMALHTTRHIDPELEYAFGIGNPVKAGWGVPKTSPQLFRAAQAYVDHAKTDPHSEMNRVFTKYFGINAMKYHELQFMITTK